MGDDVIHLCAPGPSMSLAVVDSLRGNRVGAVGCVYQLAPWAEFLASTDRDWWEKYPDARQFAGLKFCGQSTHGGVMRQMDSASDTNSGVLAMNAAVQLGARVIRLYGFDMHGSHFFGPYTNGLQNTTERRRRIHLAQFAAWAGANPTVRVYNHTPGSEIHCFPFAEAA